MEECKQVLGELALMIILAEAKDPERDVQPFKDMLIDMKTMVDKINDPDMNPIEVLKMVGRIVEHMETIEALNAQ